MYPGCAFQSEDAPEAVACAILQSQAFSHAAPGPDFNRALSEGPRLTRPSIDVGVSLEAWNVLYSIYSPLANVYAVIRHKRSFSHCATLSVCQSELRR